MNAHKDWMVDKFLDAVEEVKRDQPHRGPVVLKELSDTNYDMQYIFDIAWGIALEFGHNEFNLSLGQAEKFAQEYDYCFLKEAITA